MSTAKGMVFGPVGLAHSEKLHWAKDDQIRTKHVATLMCVYLTVFGFFPYTECLQMNGAVSEVNNKFISHLTRAQRTPLAAATAQVSHAYCGPVSKMASQQENAFSVLRFEVSRSVITVHLQCSAQFRKDAPYMVRLFKTVRETHMIGLRVRI